MMPSSGLKKANFKKDDWVLYVPPHLKDEPCHSLSIKDIDNAQTGMVTSVGNVFVFVDFTPQGTGSQAVHPSLLWKA